MIAITAEACLSQKFKEYVAITAHWKDKQQILQSVPLQLRRFYTTHIGEAWATLLFEVLCDWDIEKSIFPLTTHNGNRVIFWVTVL